MRHLRVLLVLAAVGVAVLVLLTAYVLLTPNTASVPPFPPGSSCGASPGPTISSTNLTPDLPASFAKGAIQAFGSNASSVILGGISYYDRNHLPYDSLPALGSFFPATWSATDLTAQTSRYFAEGGVFPVGWNGTAWLIAGQTTIANITGGSAISLEHGQITNLTSLVAPYFQQQGIWIAGWDGEGWLLGGNNSQGAVLVYLQGDSVTNLTSLLPDNGPSKWIQALAWNGSGWLVGGEGIFGAYANGRFTDLLPDSPFARGAILGMDWNGSAWLVGGSPVDLAFVRGTHVQAALSPSPISAGWVNSVIAVPGIGWIVSGGTDAGNVYAPLLAAVTSDGTSTTVIDESACLPGAFQGGWIQYGAPAAAFGPHDLLLVGEGGDNPTTFASHAAAVVLSVGA
jgi:hypothetical protein